MNLKESFFFSIVYTAKFLEIVVITMILFVLGMLLTNNQLENNLVLLLTIAGAIGGFWGFCFQRLETVHNDEKEKLKTHSYGSCLLFWFYRILLLCVVAFFAGIFARVFHMI